MKIVTCYNVEDDVFEIINIYNDQDQKTKSLQCVMDHIDGMQGDRNWQIVMSSNEVYVFERGLFFGKTLLYRYVICDFVKANFKNVMSQMVKNHKEKKDDIDY